MGTVLAVRGCQATFSTASNLALFPLRSLRIRPPRPTPGTAKANVLQTEKTYEGKVLAMLPNVLAWKIVYVPPPTFPSLSRCKLPLALAWPPHHHAPAVSSACARIIGRLGRVHHPPPSTTTHHHHSLPPQLTTPTTLTHHTGSSGKEAEFLGVCEARIIKTIVGATAQVCLAMTRQVEEVADADGDGGDGSNSPAAYEVTGDDDEDSDFNQLFPAPLRQDIPVTKHSNVYFVLPTVGYSDGIFVGLKLDSKNEAFVRQLRHCLRRFLTLCHPTRAV